MVTARPITRSLGTIAAALVLIALASCTTDQPTDPSVTGISAAKGGGSPKVKVNSTDPSSAEQDTTLDVRILGSGFVEGSEARFLLDGVEVPGVQRNGNTQFVSESEVIANITIAVDAIVELYDAEVRTPRGKKGVGADLFQVVQKGSGGPLDAVPLQVTFRDALSDGVLSDAVIGGSLVYTDGVDKVSAHLRQENGHFRLFTAFQLKGKEEALRRLCYDFGVGASGIPPSFGGGQGCDNTNLGKLMAKGMVTANQLALDGSEFPGGMVAMEPGDQMTMRSSTYFEVDGFGWFLRYGRDCDKNDFPFNHPSRVTVTGGADNDADGLSDVWTIEASGPAILCKTTLKGKSQTTPAGPFTMPFLLTAVRQ